MKILFALFLLMGHVYAKDITLTYDFNNGLQGWKVAFADYPPGEEDFFELNSAIKPLPSEISTTRKGLFITGNNHSDDLYMFMTKSIGRAEGIIPGAEYDVRFRITFDSNAPTGCLGTGGAPGESVELLVNTINERPRTFVDDQNIIRTVFGHGNLVSNIANGIDCEVSQGEYVRLVKLQPSTIRVRTDKDGKLWLVVGTDSGFESTTALFYEKVEVIINRVH